MHSRDWVQLCFCGSWEIWYRVFSGFGFRSLQLRVKLDVSQNEASWRCQPHGAMPGTGESRQAWAVPTWSRGSFVYWVKSKHRCRGGIQAIHKGGTTSKMHAQFKLYKLQWLARGKGWENRLHKQNISLRYREVIHGEVRGQSFTASRRHGSWLRRVGGFHSNQVSENPCAP